MTIGYFNKHSLDSRIIAGFSGTAFTLWETVDGKIVPVTLKDEHHNSFPQMQEMGELKQEIKKLDVPTAIQTFGKTADEILASLSTYKDANEIREILALN